MLEPEEFEFYEKLAEYKEVFGEFPPTHNMTEKAALKLIKKALESGKKISEQDTEIG
jgi:hypothetical protein